MVKVELKDGSKIEVNEGSSVLEVAKKLSEGLARNAMAAKIDGEVKDLRTIIEKDCKLEILTFDDLDQEVNKIMKEHFGTSYKRTIWR